MRQGGGRARTVGRWLLGALLLAAGAIPAAGTASAGGPASPSKRHRDPVWKFSFQYFDDWAPVPLEADDGNPRGWYREAEVVKYVQKDEYVKSGRFWAGQIEVFRMGGPAAATTGEKGGGAGTGPKPRRPEPDAPKDMRSLLAEIAGRTGGVALLDPKKAKAIKSKDGVAGSLWTLEKSNGAYMLFATWGKDGVEVGMWILCDAQLKKKYELGFGRVVSSFTWFDEKAEDVRSLDVLDGVRISAKKRRQIEKGLVKGWDVIVSPMKNYIVIYNRNGRRNDRLAKILAERIEAIRAQIYEMQFAPAKPIEAVSVMRVCGDLAEYHAYGGPYGSAGYWSDQTEELVFYDANPKDSAPDDDTLAVCYHEAFHQYIYYSVGKVAPHSWFNEGHGDYYAGARYGGSRFNIRPFNWRVKRVKAAIKAGPSPYEEKTTEDGTSFKFDRSGGGYSPLKALVRMSKGEYYSYPGVSYAQGWSLVYFLREIVPKNKEWNAKWGSILDTYFTTLKAEVNKETPLVPKSVDDEPDDPGMDDDPAPPTTPGMAEPGMGDAPAPGMDEPGTTDPGMADPGMGEAPAPGTGEPGMGDAPTPGTGEPGMGETPPGMGDTPPPPAPGMGDAPPPGMDEPGMGGDDPGDEEPPESRIAITIFGAEGSRKALKKAVEEAFRGVDFDELEAAWVKEILKIPDPPKRR
jgi:hypothetical protein